MDPRIDDAIAQRVGARRVIPRWEFRHLRAPGYVRVGSGLVLTTCSLLTLGLGGDDAKTYGWAPHSWRWPRSTSQGVHGS